LTPEQMAVAMFGGLLVGIFTGFPVAFVLIGIALIFGFVAWGSGVTHLLVTRTFYIVSNDVLVAVPLFVFMGCIMERSGIWDRLFGALQIALGPLRGSLALTTGIICTIFAAGTGIVGSEITVMGLMALPAMLKRGYDKKIATGIILAAGTLGILIPPSIMLILYGLMASISIAKLFTAGIFPGLLLSSIYLIYVATRCFFQPHLGPPLPPEERAIPLLKLAGMLLVTVISPLLLIFAVLGSIIVGIAAPTEAASVGGFGALVLAIIYRAFSWQMLKEAVYRTVRVSSMILLVAVGSSCFAGVFLRLGGGLLIEDFLLGLPIAPIGLILLILLGIFLMGMFVDWIAILFVFIPLITPVVGAVGFDPLWFALVVCVCLQTSFLTPPFAVSIFYLRGVAPPEVTLPDIFRSVVPFIGLQLLGLAIIMIFPQIILWLPSVVYK